MESQYSSTNSGPGGRTTSTHLLPDCSDYICGRTEKAASLAVESDCRVHYRITPKKKGRGQATVCIGTASTSASWGHFKTALKAARVEQTDKLFRAAWHQAEQDLCCAVTFPGDTWRGFISTIPPPLIQTYIKSSPHPLCITTLQSAVQLQASWVQSLHYKMIECWEKSHFQLLWETLQSLYRIKDNYVTCWLTTLVIIPQIALETTHFNHLGKGYATLRDL